MQYMCLIYSAENAGPQPGTPEFNVMIKEYQSFTADVQTNGKMVHGDALQSIDTATTVTLENGKREVTDGPFAETKETLGGYYLLDCESLDEAIDLAAKIPTAKYGRIEVRPVVVWDN